MVTCGTSRDLLVGGKGLIKNIPFKSQVIDSVWPYFGMVAILFV